MQDGPGLHFELAERVLREMKNQGMAGMCLEGYSEEQAVYEHFGKHSESARKTGKDGKHSAIKWGGIQPEDPDSELLRSLDINNQ
jgi:hypothetical protein